MSYQVINPFIQFIDSVNGNPLSAGSVYFGRQDSDPKNQPANRINVYAVQDNGTEVLLSQPITLNGAGQPQINGSVKQIKIDLHSGDTSYAIQAFSRSGAQKIYQPRAPVLIDSISLGDANSSVLIAGIPASNLASEYATQRLFRADAYGLKTTNNGLQNCQALQALSNAVKAAGGGRVLFPSGTYRVGAQTLAGATGKGYAYLFEKMFDVRDLPNSGIHIHFENTKFELESGLRFGAFDPVTGNPLANSPPNFNNDTQAGTGYLFVTVNVRDILVTGKCEIDGRDTTRIIGGFFGDQGRQCTEYGFQFLNYRRLKIEGFVYCHHLLLDGLYTQALSSGDDCYTIVDGYVGLYNSRQAWSCCGGSNNFLINSVLGLTGYNLLSTSPASGVDLEPEGVPIVGFSAINCYFPRSKGPCYVSDNFNVNGVKFTNCEFENTEFSTVYSVLKDIVFDTCTFRGLVYNVIPGTNSNQKGFRPKFKNCDFYDRTRDGGFARRFPGQGGNGGILFNTVNADFEDCRGDAEISTTYPVIGFMDGSNLRDVSITVRGDWTNMTGYEVFYCRGSDYIQNFTIKNVGSGTQAGDSVSGVMVLGTKLIENAFISFGLDGTNSLIWDSVSLAGGARALSRRNESTVNPQAWDSLSLWKNDSSVTSLAFAGAHKIYSYGAVPSNGLSFRRGDLILNNTPSPSATPAWVCTTSGIAGSTAVFKPYANVGA